MIDAAPGINLECLPRSIKRSICRSIDAPAGRQQAAERHGKRRTRASGQPSRREMSRRADDDTLAGNNQPATNRLGALIARRAPRPQSIGFDRCVSQSSIERLAVALGSGRGTFFPCWSDRSISQHINYVLYTAQQAPIRMHLRYDMYAMRCLPPPQPVVPLPLPLLRPVD